MDFDLSTEQQLLKDSVERFIRDDYDFVRRRAIAEEENGFSAAVWKSFAELGWLGMPLPEDCGGLGATSVDVMLLMEAFGRGLVIEPYLQSIILGGGLIAELGSEPQRETWLPQLASGELRVALASAEPCSRYSLGDIATHAVADGDRWRLSGHKSVVIGGPHADKYIVSARTSGEVRDAQGVSLFVVDRDAPGLDRVDGRGFDRTPVSELIFDKVDVGADHLLGPVGEAFPALEHAADRGIAALCAEAVGAMSVLNDATNEYLKTRKQFGQPIGRFQVLQHRMVDMYTELEQTRSLTYLATLKLDASYQERRRAVSAAKAQMGRAGKFVGSQAVQLHGGMGMTDELMVSHYYKRLMMLDITLGNREHHLKAFTALTQ
ncbi:MAG: acyl-CoA dehydrogenase [Pseudomonadota bacterium]